jgi:hypothetical protein
MKSWQNILINGCVTVLAVIVAMGILMPDVPPDKTTEIRESLNAQIKGIQVKLSIIEEAILNQKKQISMTPGPNKSAKNPEDLAKLEQKLDMILGKLAVLENTSSRTQTSQSFGSSLAPPMIPHQPPPSLSVTGKGTSSWTDSLTDDKKREVEIIFEEHAMRMREKLPPPEPDGRLPDRETIKKIMEESDLELNQELKTILTDNEYQRFLESHPSPVMQAPNMPGIQEKP